MPFTEAYLIQSHRAFKLSEHIAAQLGSIWATSTIGLYRHTVPNARSLARKSANHNSSGATVDGDATRVLSRFFACFLGPLAVYHTDNVEREQ
jgi:hypothetical protein